MFQLDDRVGSLEKGKDADFVAFSGNPFELTSRVVLVGVMVAAYVVARALNLNLVPPTILRSIGISTTGLKPSGKMREGSLQLWVEDAAVETHFAEVQPRFREHGTDLFQGRRAFRHISRRSTELVTKISTSSSS